MPAHFSILSDRLVAQYGVLLMGAASLAVLWVFGASVDVLVVLYSINVFITFSLSQLGMVRHWWLERRRAPRWKRKLFINGFGLLLSAATLISLTCVKFKDGGWITLLVTGILIGLAFWVKSDYRQAEQKLQRLNELVAAAMADDAIVAETAPPPCDVNARTAVFPVTGFNGLGLHTLFAVARMFPKVYQNFIFLQVGVLDAGNFKGANEVEHLREHCHGEVRRYAAYMSKRGFYTESHCALGTDMVDEFAKLCDAVAEKFPQSQFFAAQLVFQNENLITRWLHNQTVTQLQRRLYQNGRPMLILPVKV
jgi:K+ transporter